MRLLISALLCPFLFFNCHEILGQTKLSGSWDCHLVCPGGQLKFGLIVSETNGDFSAFITNGNELIPVPVVQVNGDIIEFAIDHYDSKISAEYAGGKLAGKWKKLRGLNEWVEMKFAASKTRQAVPAQNSENGSKDIEGRWLVDFKSSDDPAVGEFQSNTDGSVSGTFLTTTGDYRFLHGRLLDRTLELSCFDGAHAFLFRAKLNDDKTLAGDFWSSNTWHEKWSAKKDPNAKLPDAFKQTTLQPEHSIADFKFPDINGVPTSLDAKSFSGKAKLIYVFGSWCPNCHDAAAYFKELKKQFGDDLSIVGLAFELTGEFERDAKQVKKYLKRNDVDYPVLVAGLANKKLAGKAIPFLDEVRSYPTTIFLDQDGKVHAIHTGFSGPATGEAYTELKSRFESHIKELIDMAK